MLSVIHRVSWLFIQTSRYIGPVFWTGSLSCPCASVEFWLCTGVTQFYFLFLTMVDTFLLLQKKYSIPLCMRSVRHASM